MSRNVPTQLSNQWANPRAYAIYNHVIHNIGLDQSNDVVPQWLQEQGGVKLSDSMYLTPDWGMVRANQVLWGLGRGSSVSSYVLYLLGVHRINSLYYDLPIEEFLK